MQFLSVYRTKQYEWADDCYRTAVNVILLLAQLMVDAFDERAMAIFDIPGAYLNLYMPEDKFLLLKLGDDFVNIICEVNP